MWRVPSSCFSPAPALPGALTVPPQVGSPWASSPKGLVAALGAGALAAPAPLAKPQSGAATALFWGLSDATADVGQGCVGVTGGARGLAWQQCRRGHGYWQRPQAGLRGAVAAGAWPWPGRNRPRPALGGMAERCCAGEVARGSLRHARCKSHGQGLRAGRAQPGSTAARLDCGELCACLGSPHSAARTNTSPCHCPSCECSHRNSPQDVPALVPASPGLGKSLLHRELCPG